ncbi:MAG: transketolase [Patescibacteria group bacterium]
MKHLKRKILEMAVKAGEGHIPSAFSVLDILWVLYDRVLDTRPHTKGNDHFILSKGHSSMGLYIVLAEKGFIQKDILETLGKFESILGGHPDRTKMSDIEASTGSLGHGLPMAVGLALGMRIKKEIGRVYTIIGDGECNEGTIWESALLASHHRLNNLYCIVDYNHSGDRALSLGDLRAKFESFGWDSVSIDGHNHDEIYKILTKKSDVKPMAIIANTVKGKGLKVMENNHEWHHKTPKYEELMAFMEELK